jgi:hypothetical protein
LRVDEAEGIDDDFALNRLNWVNNYSDGAWSKLLEGLLGVNVDRGEPAAKAGMGVVPSYHCFGSGERSAK